MGETEKAYQREKTNKLLLSILMDAIGMSTFLIPGIAEIADLAWAPIAAVTNFLMFRGTTIKTAKRFLRINAPKHGHRAGAGQKHNVSRQADAIVI